MLARHEENQQETLLRIMIACPTPPPTQEHADADPDGEGSAAAAAEIMDVIGEEVERIVMTHLLASSVKLSEPSFFHPSHFLGRYHENASSGASVSKSRRIGDLVGAVLREEYGISEPKVQKVIQIVRDLDGGTVTRSRGLVFDESVLSILNCKG